MFGSGFQFKGGRELGIVYVEAAWQVQQNGTVVAETAAQIGQGARSALGAKKTKSSEKAGGKAKKKPKK